MTDALNPKTPAGKLRKLNPGSSADMPTQIGSGINFPVAKLIELLEPGQWEEFTEEWATSLKSYKNQPERWSGPGDMGRDIVAFTTDQKYNGAWDNYQCKRYAGKLQPHDVWLEFGKVIYYTFKGEFPPPANYHFAASKGVGLKLQRLLANPAKLHSELIKNWDDYCRKRNYRYGGDPAGLPAARLSEQIRFHNIQVQNGCRDGERSRDYDFPHAPVRVCNVSRAATNRKAS